MYYFNKTNFYLLKPLFIKMDILCSQILTLITPVFQDRRQNGFTVFEVRSKKLTSLPIVSFMPGDYGNPWQKFGFEAGPVCFH